MSFVGYQTPPWCLFLAVDADAVGAGTGGTDTSPVLSRHVDEVQEAGTTGIPIFVSPETVMTSKPLTKRSLCVSVDTVSPLNFIGEPLGKTVLLFKTPWVGLTKKIWEAIVTVSWVFGPSRAIIRLIYSRRSKNTVKKKE